ncbi:beta strand repeat-containing protein, partial [Flavobacterium sp. LB2P6]|uniref:beta strand repeat-containing protein n=1 Tax=Flavobacterium sp. LB2P6 TaxID=3401714 RepID=UPI003AADCCD4
MKTFLLKSHFQTIVFLVANLFFTSVALGQATVTTDKDDYAPGEYVIITGTGWTPGETVTLHFDETPKPETCLLSHDLTAVADSNGTIYNNQFLIKINHIGVAFLLTATGQTSGQVATRNFTDGNIRLQTNSGSISVSAYNHTTLACGGSFGSVIITSVTTTNPGVTVAAANGSQSSFVKATQLNSLNQVFSSWTTNEAFTTPDSSKPYEICVVGKNGTIDFTANYVTCTPPSAPTISSHITYCQGTTAIPLTATGSNLLWYTVANGGTGSGSAPTPSTASSGTLSYYVSQTIGCESSRAKIDVVINGINSGVIAKGATQPGPGCGTLDPGTTSTTASNGSGVLTYAWQQSTDGGASWTIVSGATSDQNNPPELTVTTSFKRIVTSTVNGVACSAESNKLIYVVNPLPTVTPISPGGTTNVCVGSAIQLGNTSSGGSWSSANSAIATVSSSGLVAGISVGAVLISYTVTDATSGCSRAVNKTVNVLAVPAAPVAVNYTGVYDGASHTGSAITNVGETTDWYTAASGGIMTSAPTGTNAGIYSAYAEAKNTTTGCVSTTRIPVSVTITKKSASVSPIANTKVYGSPNPTLTGALVGFLEADGVTAAYSRTSGETVLGSPYTISAVLSPAGVLSNYNITYNTAAFTITTKSASVSPIANTKVYGSPEPVLTGTLAGFLTADGVTASYSRTAGETVLGGPYTISAVLSPAGVLSNYDITYNTALFTITTKAASVSPIANTKVYGSLDPTLTGALVGFLEADVVTAAYSRTSGETVLGSPYTISAVLSPAGVLSNYNITYNTAAFTITTKAASVSPIANTKVYGSPNPTLEGALVGFLSTDEVTAAYSRTLGETVLGSPYTISAVLSPAGVLSNYNITYNTALFTITTKSASVSPIANTKVYGSPNPTLTGALVGFLDTDTVTAAYSRTSGETVLGSPYTISAVLSPAGVLSNYNITYNTALFTITTKSASVSPMANTKVYGSPNPTLEGALVGFLSTDEVTAAYSRTLGETVLGSPYTISAVLSPAGVLSNYNITYNTAAFTITTKSASVSPIANTKVYGSPNPTLEGALVGFLSTDEVTAAYSRTSGETVLGSPYTISAVLSPSGVLSNYNITYNTAAFTITTKSASVSPMANTKVYGSSDPTLTGALVGFLEADVVTAAYSRTSGETVLGSPYTISAVLSPSGVLSNYNITYNTAAFTITTKSASVSPIANTKVYGSSDPTLMGALVGFLEADGVTAAYSRTLGETVLGSPYTISAVLSPTGVLSNYNITYNTAAFTITTKSASVSPMANTKVYGSSDPTLTGALVGFLEADVVTAAYSRTLGETVLGSPYTISAVLSPTGVLSNYNITYNTAAFTITTKSASVSPMANTKVYGSSDPTLTGALVGFLSTDEVTAAYSRTSGETVLGSPYTISAVLSPSGVLSNYNITYNT